MKTMQLVHIKAMVILKKVFTRRLLPKKFEEFVYKVECTDYKKMLNSGGESYVRTALFFPSIRFYPTGFS